MTNEVALDDIYYFSVVKKRHQQVYDLVRHVVEESQKNENDALEIQRRLQLLAATRGNEHLRQCSNFLAEATTYLSLVDENRSPHWVPETTLPTPDIQYSLGDRQHPDEVKHLNSPRVEHDALASGKMVGGSVNPNYDQGLQQKIEDFVESARRKFASFNQVINGTDSTLGTLHLYFSRSIDAGLMDGIEWEKTMKERVFEIAAPLCGDDITLVVTDIDEQFRDLN